MTGHAKTPEAALSELREVLRALAGPAAPPKHPVTMPCPEDLDPVKWAQLDRKTRRALQRHHEKVQRKAWPR